MKYNVKAIDQGKNRWREKMEQILQIYRQNCNFTPEPTIMQVKEDNKRTTTSNAFYR